MNNAILILMIYWGISYLYLIIWSIRIRQKNNLTNLNKVGEVLIYAITVFIGIFIIYLVKPINLKKGSLP